MTLDKIIRKLQALANPEKVIYKEKKFGVVAHNSLGVYGKDLNNIAKEIGKNNELAIQLFDSEIYEARLLCSKIFRPKDISEALMDYWTPTFNNWEICDSFSMGLYSKSPFAVKKINEWSTREPEFEKRAAFATMASYCMADKKAGNEVYEAFFPLIKEQATDERLYVKKAVNWGLRSIGKRNIDLNKQALFIAKEINQMESKAAQWIAKDAIRELEGEKVNILDYPRAIYRPIKVK
ncbi:MAG: 3-methyladenine DNA glycosylase AlkD [Sediminicola sp.]|jgi:3-methyladenine DNA glycosylase AlkD|tara:strand:- start:1120 stop:1830 length:711 start_codon:yes stop_codon:yes gene_type:complete